MTNLAHSVSTTSVRGDEPHYDSFVHCLAAAASEVPERTAIVCENRQISYSEYARGAAGLAKALGALIQPQDRVIVMMGNSIEFAIAAAGTLASGAQAALVNPYFTEGELSKVFALADARAIVCNPASREKAAGLASDAGIEHIVCLDLDSGDLPGWLADGDLSLEDLELPDPGSLALLLFTGGTTGLPKGVDLEHGSMSYTMQQHCAMWPLEFDKERFLSVAPMFHVWGLGNATWIPVYVRGTLVIIPRYDPEAILRAFDKYKITVFAGGPAPIYAGLLTCPLIHELTLDSLKYAYSGGAPCSEALHFEWEDVTGCGIYEGYGMTEGAPIALNPAWGERRINSVGLPVPGTEIQIVDVETGTRVLDWEETGEVRIRGPQTTPGYRDNPEETAILLRDGWLYTGDIGYLASDGYLSIVDRKKQMVIVGGFNVFPREVDDVLAENPDIAEAASAGKPHPRLGEVIVAWVVAREGATLGEEDVLAWCKERLVKYKRPVEIMFIDSLPRTGAGKIDKRALTAQLTG